MQTAVRSCRSAVRATMAIPVPSSASAAPTQMGAVKIAVFADTCGNLIQLYQPG